MKSELQCFSSGLVIKNCHFPCEGEEAQDCDLRDEKNELASLYRS